MKQWLAGLVMAGVWLYVWNAQAGECTRADSLFNQAVQAGVGQEALLEQLLAQCPTYVPALNNLAVVREQQGRLPQAEALYRQILTLQDSYAPAHAGLGDVLAARGEHREAAQAYGAFLELLANDHREGRSNPLFAHEETYRQRLETAKKQIDTTQTVSASQIASALASDGADSRRGFKRSRKPPQIDLYILFETGSHQVKGESLAQLEQLATALADGALAASQFIIEGHTDQVGSEAANLKLSQRRAEEVRNLLVERHGLQLERFKAVGRGETQPVASNADEQGRALNRRVTLINAGGMAH